MKKLLFGLGALCVLLGALGGIIFSDTITSIDISNYGLLLIIISQNFKNENNYTNVN